MYALQSDSLRVEGARLTGRIVNEANKAQFDLTLTSYGDTVRLLMDEAAPNNRYQVRCCGGVGGKTNVPLPPHHRLFAGLNIAPI